MNLSWTVPNNDYFVYNYTLRELTTGTEKTLTGGYYAIAEGGTYQVVIKVFSKDGLYLGNKVYAFTVAGDNELFYYVRYQGSAIDSNSTFKLREIASYANLFYTMNVVGDIAGENDIPTTNLPLYIVKEVEGKLPVSVIINEDLVINDPENTKGVIEAANYTFYFYQVKTTTRSKFFGILVVKESKALVSEATVGNGDNKNVTAINTIFTLASNTNETFAINAKYFSNLSDYILSRNTLMVEMYYNSSIEPVKVIEVPVTSNGTPKVFKLAISLKAAKPISVIAELEMSNFSI
jgi:hypothetical protein